MRHKSVGVVSRSRTIFCRPGPNPSVRLFRVVLYASPEKLPSHRERRRRKEHALDGKWKVGYSVLTCEAMSWYHMQFTTKLTYDARRVGTQEGR